MSAQKSAETHSFQTQAKQLLQLMIHSLYSNREIFLRELISNASDAIDKLRFEALNNDALLAEGSDYAIDVLVDSDAKTITIRDNGIGMTREEVIEHLGTIAKSGTAEFLERLTGDQKKDAGLIGQFGVGFYSAFIVADEVEVLTRPADGSEGTRWKSKGEDEFSVESEADLPRGTSVILHLKSDAEEFAESYRLRSIVVKYSDHIGVPVRMEKPPTPDTSDSSDEEKDEKEAVESAAVVLESVNDGTALWSRSRKDVKDEEYIEFYKHISHDFEDPITWSHNKVEGKLEYTSLIYLPKRAPHDLWNRDAPRGLKLYVQKVFIMDDAEQFLPLYLRFVKGVVDSSDLPLNVSREILQQDASVTSIRSALTKRALSTLDKMAKKSPEDYQIFWGEFGATLKEGIGEDFANKEAIAKLLRFASTKSDGENTVGLTEYLERMVADQNKIYYVIGENHQQAAASPHLEIFKKKGIEVLLLSERIDEWLMSHLHEFDGKSFQDAMRGDIELPGANKKDDEKAEDASDKDEDVQDDDLGERMKAVLGDQVETVKISTRLTDSPACLVLGATEMGAQMRQMMAAAGQEMPEGKPIFEYNAEHALVKRMDGEADEERFADLVQILFDQAAIMDGRGVQDSAAYASRLNKLLVDLLA